ncbi:MAG: beta-hydroxyacyl-ACP dehydratase, partial [Rubrivivax sp.]|nr:beta-hydroxyacyl-ACP dehydratase [Rubrivivax sp.]
RDQLESAFLPRRVVHVDVLPREATGKLTVAALRRFALQTLSAAQAPVSALPASDMNGDLNGDTTFDIPTDHPSFAGHFPGHPVLPGVVLLSLLMQALAQRPALAARVGATPRIDNAKFLHAVGPGSTLRVALREQGSGVTFDIWQGNTAVARGQLSAGAG